MSALPHLNSTSTASVSFRKPVTGVKAKNETLTEPPAVEVEADQVHLTGNKPSTDTLSGIKLELNQEPVEQPSSEIPKTLVEQPAEPAVKEEETNWVLESANATPYADTPAMNTVRQRFERIPKEVQTILAEPLLDALTNANAEVAGKKLEEVALTATWAQKFKKEAARLGDSGGYAAMLNKARELEQGDEPSGPSRLDKVLASPQLVFSSELAEHRAKEAESLLEQFESGNESPGIGSKALGKGISYLRGRKGVRIFFKKQAGETQWLAVCDKSTEPKAIKLLQQEYKLS